MNENHAVWDPLVRVGHWSLAVFFALAYYTGGDEFYLHEHAGYTVGLIVLFRVFWGVAGFDHARFGDFAKSPGRVVAYLAALVRGERERYVGHDPAGGVMIFAILMSITVTAVSGMALFAMEDRGPLASTFVADWPGAPVEAVHELSGDLSLVLVIGHVAGVLVMSYLLKENLVASLLHGKKRHGKKRE